MTDTRPSTIAREALLGVTTVPTNASVLAREVLLSQVTQTWASVIAREALLSVPLVTQTFQTAVTVG